MDVSPEGRQYVQRYHVYDFPHMAIIDPRTGRLMWKKEGWTQENPVTAETFAEMAMDFCSRNSFDRPPQAPRPPGAKGPPKPKPMHELSEEEQLQVAMRASMEDTAETPSKEDTDDSDVECLGTKDEMMQEQEEDAKPAATPSVIEELLKVPVGEEPAKGARMQLKMPDGKRVVRRFNMSDQVKIIYAFLAVSWWCSPLAPVLIDRIPANDALSLFSNQMKKQKGDGNSLSWRDFRPRICGRMWRRPLRNAGFPGKL